VSIPSRWSAIWRHGTNSTETHIRERQRPIVILFNVRQRTYKATPIF
jgi:hypothetical protein